MSDDLITYQPHRLAAMADSENGRECMDDYIQMRIRGISREEAIIIAFELIQNNVRLHNVGELALAVETTQYFRDNFGQRLGAAKSSEIWDEKIALNSLAKLAHDPDQRGNVRLAAMKELNVLCGITIMDDKGNSRLANGHNLDYFNQLQADHKARAH